MARMLPGRVDDQLLALAGAVSWDSGDGVVGVLRTLLERAAPYEAGEVAVAHPTGFQRWTLTDDDSPLMGEDLLVHVAARPHPLRLDDLHEVEPYGRTRELLERRGMRSLLVLPLSSAGGAEGAIGVACAHGWAFVGCSLRGLVPLASMAGLALAQARGLTALRRMTDGARGFTETAAAPPAPSAQERGELARRLSEAQVALQQARAELARERERSAELEAREAHLVEQREGLDRELGELRESIAARQALLAPAPAAVGRKRHGRR
jgi:hypothetical protein